MKDIELLSPAGSRDALEAAIKYGADAVYLGGKDFGARMLADNFNRTELQDSIRYAHLRDVKIYVTVNTLANNKDLLSMARHMQDLYAMGADGVIVQDIGAALLAREYVPDLPVHASTQMTIHNRAQVKWAEEQGLRAVVVSREVPLHELAPMFQDLTIRPEVFVHGALCYSFSGQCNFSHIRQGRSANCGECAQPCRRTYNIALEKGGKQQIIETEAKYPLSMRDLCTIEEIDKIVSSNVALVKIEGRMKRPEYVGVTTGMYRKYIDQAREGTFAGVDQKDLDLLWLAYNRGFTKGYLFDQRFGKVKGRLSIGTSGLLLGTVAKIDPAHNRMRIEQPLTNILPHAGDVVKVTGPDPRIKSLSIDIRNVEKVDDGSLLLNSIREVEKGDQAYLVEHNMLQYLDPVDKGIPVQIDATIKKGNTVSMTARGENTEVTVEGTEIVSEARTRPLEKDAVAVQVYKTGANNITISRLAIELEDGCFVTIGELNKVRRKLFEQFEQKWLANNYPIPQRTTPVENTAIPRPQKKKKVKQVALCAITADPQDIPMLREKGVKRIYLDIFYGFQQKKGKEHAIEQVKKNLGRDVFIKTPRITLDNILPTLEETVAELRGEEFGGYMVGNLGALEAVKKADPDTRVVAAASFNITNAVSAEYMLNKTERVSLGVELTEDEIMDIASRVKDPDRLDIVAGGKHTLLITQDCLLCSTVDQCTTGPGGFYDRQCNVVCSKGNWYLKDDKKRMTPLWMDRDCRGHLFNHRVADIDTKKIVRSGIHSFIIDIRGFSSSEKRGALNTFKEKLGI